MTLDIDSAEEVHQRVIAFKKREGLQDNDFDLRVTVGQDDQDSHTRELFVEVMRKGAGYWEFI